MKEFKVTIGWSKDRPFINVLFKGERFRYSNGKSIGLNIKAKDDPELLCNAFKIKLLEGWEPEKRRYKNPSHDLIHFKATLLDQFELVVEGLRETEYSYHHIRDCNWVFTNFKKYLSTRNLTEITPMEWDPIYLKDFINSKKSWSNRTKKNVLTTFRFLSRGLDLDNNIRLSQSKSKLHRKIDNLNAILNEIRLQDAELHLTALITYGCLLRPHMEIRLLKWSEIDLERGLISLDGYRNKTGRNRIVPIPIFVIQALRNIHDNNNNYVFGNGLEPVNKDYFKTKWTRYKRSSKIDLKNITLYSFRHTGAINVFEKTGSIQKVKEVMGHSNIQATLIYLRGLDTTDLSVKDMPTLNC